MSARRWTVLLLLAAAVTYSSTRVENHAEAEDSLHYAAVAARGDFRTQLLTHGNHLLGAPLAHLAVRVPRGLGVQTTAEVALQVANAVLAVLALALLLRILQRLRVQARLRAGLFLSVTFSYGIWRYATESDVYMLPLVLMMIVWSQLRSALDEPHRRAMALRLGLACGLAILSHQQQVLTVAAVAIALAFDRSLPRTVRLRRTVTMVTVAGAVTVGAYLLAGGLWLGYDGGELLGWLRGPEGSGFWGHAGLGSLVRAPIGFVRSLVGGHFLFALGAVSDRLTARLSGTLLAEELFLARAFSPLGAVALLSATAMGLACASLFVFRLARTRRARRRQAGHRAEAEALPVFVSRFAVPSVVAYALFAAWWDPDNVEFWIPVLPALAIVAGGALGRSKPDRLSQLLGAVAVAALAAVNFWGSILPQCDPSYDYWRAFNQPIFRNAGPGDIVVSGSGWVSQGYVELYTGASVFTTLRDDARLDEDFYRQVDASPRARVLVSSTVADPPAALVKWRDVDPSVARAFFARLEPRLHLLGGGEQAIYEWRR